MTFLPGPSQHSKQSQGKSYPIAPPYPTQEKSSLKEKEQQFWEKKKWKGRMEGGKEAGRPKGYKGEIEYVAK